MWNQEWGGWADNKNDRTGRDRTKHQDTGLKWKSEGEGRGDGGGQYVCHKFEAPDADDQGGWLAIGI